MTVSMSASAKGSDASSSAAAAVVLLSNWDNSETKKLKPSQWIVGISADYMSRRSTADSGARSCSYNYLRKSQSMRL